MTFQTDVTQSLTQERWPVTLLAFILVVLLILVPGMWISMASDGVFRDQATVIRVVDGDTIVVLLDGEEEYVRYIGIDTPETDEEGGQYATQLNTYLVGDIVYLQRDKSDRDKYGRLLRYVWNADNEFVNCELLEGGAAEVAVYPPDTQRIPELLECVP